MIQIGEVLYNEDGIPICKGNIPMRLDVQVFDGL